MRRSAPPDDASIRPTGTSPSRCAGSEIAQPSIMLIRVQLRSARRFCVVKALSSARSALVDEIDVVGRALRLAAHDAHGYAGIVDVALGRDEIAMPGIAFGGGETT